MVVYCVMEHDWEGSFLAGIYSTQELAQAKADIFNKASKSDSYNVEEWEVDESQ